MMGGNSDETVQKPSTTTTQIAKWKVKVILTLCFFECLLFGGTVFGWPVLAFVFKTDDVYTHSCNQREVNPVTLGTPLNTSQKWDTPDDRYTNRSVTYHKGDSNQSRDVTYKFTECPSQDAHFSMAYTLAIVIMGLMAFPVGWLFDRFGLMVTRIVATCLCLPALVMLATCRDELSWMMYLALPMLSTTNIIIIVTNNHVCTLARERTSTMIALYSGTVSASGVIFIFIKLAHDAGIPRFTSLLALLVGWILVGVTTFFLLPRFKVIPNAPKATHEPLHTSKESHQQENKISTTQTYSVIPNKEPEDGKLDGGKSNGLPLDGKSSAVRKKRGSFLMALGSPYFFLHVVWFSVLHLRVHCFAGSFVPWASGILKGETSRVAMACDVFGYTQVLCIFTSPIVGLLLDRSRGHLNARQVAGRQRAVAALTPLVMGSLVSGLLGVSVLVTAPWVVFVAPELSHVGRSLLYATAIAYLDFSFPKKHFGKLVGLMYFIGGAGSFLQHAFFLFAKRNGFIQANSILLVLSLLTLVHPLVIYLKSRRARRHSDQHIQLKGI